jgi:cytochrome c553
MKAARWGLVALTANLICVSAALADGDAAAGRQKFYTCVGCHGIPNYNNVYPTYRVPKLGGQNAQYIEDALKEYKSGARNHPTMHAQASSLSDQDIADIAAYLSTAQEKKD